MSTPIWVPDINKTTKYNGVHCKRRLTEREEEPHMVETSSVGARLCRFCMVSTRIPLMLVLGKSVLSAVFSLICCFSRILFAVICGIWAQNTAFKAA
jgi:hypothetical protein